MAKPDVITLPAETPYQCILHYISGGAIIVDLPFEAAIARLSESDDEEWVEFPASMQIRHGFVQVRVSVKHRMILSVGEVLDADD